MVVFVNVIVRQVAAGILALTGLDKQTANFQALSALTGTGFTTMEAEQVLSHPVRRRTIATLMITGNAGLIAVIAGLVSSFLTITSAWAILQFVILVVALYIIFKMATHTRIVRIFSKKVEEKLRERFKFEKIAVAKVLDLGKNFGIAEVILQESSPYVGKTLASSGLGREKILVLAIERDEEKILVPKGNHKLRAGDNLICYGSFEQMGQITQVEGR